jgi:hypothetical protein
MPSSLGWGNSPINSAAELQYLEQTDFQISHQNTWGLEICWNLSQCFSEKLVFIDRTAIWLDVLSNFNQATLITFCASFPPSRFPELRKLPWNFVSVFVSTCEQTSSCTKQNKVPFKNHRRALTWHDSNWHFKMLAEQRQAQVSH